MKQEIIILVVILIIIGGYFLFKGDNLEEPIAEGIIMESGNLFFNPRALKLTKDESVKITFQNFGTHTFTIDELGVDIPLLGTSETIEFTPNKAGSFEYYCAVPGHREGGMFGLLEVE